MNRIHGASVTAWLLVLTSLACSSSESERNTPPQGVDAVNDGGSSAPSSHTIRKNRELAAVLALEDPRDFEDARRGRIAQEESVRIVSGEGRLIWDTDSYAFIEGDAPDSVNPSLWRQEKLNNEHGLFEVSDGIYQVRGYDLANMSLIEGETGWIVVDPLGSRETAMAAMALVNKHLGEKPIRAILFTHSHIDHFGGVEGIVDVAAVRDQGIEIVAPEGLMEEATSENILAGTAMGRRASFMFGMGLERSATGHVGSGLGKAPSAGDWTIMTPTIDIDETGQRVVLDGIEFVFQHTPESEAPSEFVFYLPQKKALFGAEVVSRNMHNVLTLRGAKVRDALKWSGYIDETMQLYPDAEVLVNSHHWPVWGKESIASFLEGQRDTYKFIHDQSVRLANQGQTAVEIGDELELPASLSGTFANRGYYGTTSHNARAVYQHYFGFYDGNPANLNPLPPVEEARRYVNAMGGGDRILALANEAYAEGDYRWVARLLGHLVFAEPENDAARHRLAQTYDQLGYQSESGPWRDIYLTGAFELRSQQPSAAVDVGRARGILNAIPISGFLDALAVRIDPEKVEGEKRVFNFVFTDIGETHVVEIGNSVLNHRQSEPVGDADATVRMTRDFWLDLITGKAGLQEMVFSNEFAIEGSRLSVIAFLGSLQNPEGGFNIVTP